MPRPTFAQTYLKPVMELADDVIVLTFTLLFYASPLIAILPYVFSVPAHLATSLSTSFSKLSSFSQLFFPLHLLSHPCSLFSLGLSTLSEFCSVFSFFYFSLLFTLLFSFLPYLLTGVIYIFIMNDRDQKRHATNKSKKDRRIIGAIWPNLNNPEFNFWTEGMAYFDVIFFGGGGGWLAAFLGALGLGPLVNWGQMMLSGYIDAMNWMRNTLTDLSQTFWNHANNCLRNAFRDVINRLRGYAENILNNRNAVAANHGGADLGHQGAINSWQDMVDTLNNISGPHGGGPAPGPVMQGNEFLVQGNKRTNRTNLALSVCTLMVCLILLYVMKKFIYHIIFVAVVVLCANYI